MVAALTLAITGGTGFVGRHLIDLAVERGHRVRALTRKAQPPRHGVEWIEGNLEDREALGRLVIDSDAVIHVAGVINAPDAAGFEAGNVTGTLAMLAAATAAGTHRFVHVSSLAAREPRLSQYGASKARSEELVEGSGLDWVIVRPPAVYGPGDRETLELFKMARRGIVYMPPKGRLSVIQVDDLARLLLAACDPDAPSKIIVEPDDGRPGGWSHIEFGHALGRAVGVKTGVVSTPRALLSVASGIDRLFRRDKAKLTPDRVAYFCHPDWVVSSDRPVPANLWRPEISTEKGLAETARWYQRQGWL
ncbi:NAD-dependent epimerase/dehydratase family protein [Sphingomonas daechungensis]|uniref:NAD-dependent epimerase/dehydratase family protein n=1 Tax=Sphingomonas daechungensis TaxID=1176646 RepID=UPI001CB94910|nr:NAD-dependent epimerase/dehydratase family protein [Sphingomonas daechungensis]